MNKVSREYNKKIDKSKTETCKIKNFYNIRAIFDTIRSSIFNFIHYVKR